MGRIRHGEFDPANSDGCTLLSKPYQWLTGKQLSFRECCIEHDRAYWYGGTKSERKTADDTLRDCVKGHGHTILAWIMWIVVRIMGSPRSPLPFRWRRNVTILQGMTQGYKKEG